MNIFELSEELLNIYDELEENGGELTPELEEALKITEQDFKEKIKGYVNVIKTINGDVDLIDKETERLKALKQTKLNIIDRLSKILINAINRFGDATKAGNKYIDYGTGKVSIRRNKKIELDDELINNVKDKVLSTVSFLHFQNALNDSIAIDEDSVIDRLKEEDININKNDLENINISFEVNESISDLLKEQGYKFLKGLMEVGYKSKPTVSKTTLKTSIVTGHDSNIGKLVETESISIK